MFESFSKCANSIKYYYTIYLQLIDICTQLFSFHYLPIVKILLFMVSLVESVSRQIDEIRLSPSHQHTKETMQYSPVNNRNIHVRHHVKTRLLDSRKLRIFCEYQIRFILKYFKYFWKKFALFFRFFDSWYIIKYLLTETSGKK